MKKNIRRNYYITAILSASFLIFTLMLSRFNVKSIGPEGSCVGFSYINQSVFNSLGVHPFWYRLTDWLGLAAVLCAGTFAMLGLYQLIRYRSLKRVDKDILLLGAVYLVLTGCYLLFEEVVINYRPILIEGKLEASYPSSHTMLTVSVMITSMMQSHQRIKRKLLLWTIDLLSVLIMTVTVLGRLISGVHWFTDIVGGLLLSAVLIMLYHSVHTHMQSFMKSTDRNE